MTKTRKAWFVTIAIACLLAIGGSILGVSASNQNAVEKQSGQKQQKPLPHRKAIKRLRIPKKLGNYKKIIPRVMAVVDQHSFKNKLVKKWAIREMIDNEYVGKPITFRQGKQKAITDAKQEQAWFAVAEKEYGVQKPEGKKLDIGSPKMFFPKSSKH